MKGLFIKDYYFTFKQSKLLVICALILTIIGSISISINSRFSTFSLIGLFFFIMVCISSTASDEYYKWNIYCDALPVSRKTFVTEKYTFTAVNVLLLWIISILLMIVSNILYSAHSNQSVNLQEPMFFYLLFLSFVLFLPSVTFPVIFKFGYNKSKIIFGIITGVYSAIFSVFVTDFGDIDTDFSFQDLSYILITSIIISFLLYIISWFISTKIYNKRDL